MSVQVCPFPVFSSLSASSRSLRTLSMSLCSKPKKLVSARIMPRTSGRNSFVIAVSATRQAATSAWLIKSHEYVWGSPSSLRSSISHIATPVSTKLESSVSSGTAKKTAGFLSVSGVIVRIYSMNSVIRLSDRSRISRSVKSLFSIIS